MIDVHGHISSPDALARFPMPRSLGDVEGMIERKLAAGIGLTIVGSPVGAGAMVPVPGVDNYAQPASRLAALHDWLAQTCATYSEHLRAYVYVNPLGSDAELDAAAATLRDEPFVGFIVNTSVAGEYLDSSRADAFFAMASAAGAPVLLHPPAGPAAGGQLRDLRLIEHVARFADVTIALASIVFAGWLDKYPELRLIAASAGGAIALLAEKLDLAYAAPHWRAPGDRPPVTPAPMHTAAALRHPPSAYLRRIWIDTASPSPQALQAGLSVFGHRRLLLGTDSPPLMTPAHVAVQAIRCLPLSDSQQGRVLGDNARDLFGSGLGADAGVLRDGDGTALPTRPAAA
jgi:aminocarboxymuconate-semialdehyde decarboxylase